MGIESEIGTGWIWDYLGRVMVDIDGSMTEMVDGVLGGWFAFASFGLKAVASKRYPVFNYDMRKRYKYTNIST